MDTRTQSSTVIFRRPFTLIGLDGVQPAGTYNMETREELLDTMTSSAYRRISTSIELHGQPAGITRMATVDPQDLKDALARDTAAETQLGQAGARAEPQAMQGTDITERSRKIFGRVHKPEVHWMACEGTSGPEAVGPTTRAIEGLTRWTSLNASELTWMFLVAGVFLLSSFVR